MSNIIFHIDVNSAYLSWSAVEKLKNGSDTDLRTIPSIIGGNEKSRSVVLAKSIPAKAYSVMTGEPVAAAMRKYPFLVIEPPDHRMYAQYSDQLMSLLHTYTSDIEKLSVDECFMNYSPIAHRYASPKEGALAIKDDVKKRLGFTVNIGISNNKLLAKMASDFQKPDRVHTLFPEEIRDKMWPLPVRELYTVGKASAARLDKLGIRTIGDLAAADVEILTAHFKSHGRQMWEYANGIGETDVDGSKKEAKGIGNSITLAEDAADAETAKKVLLGLSESVSKRLRTAGQLAGSVTVEIKYATFESSSHQTAFPQHTNATQLIFEYASRLFDELWNGTPMRLLGIRTGKLLPEDAPIQLSIFDLPTAAENPKDLPLYSSSAKQHRLDDAIDSIRQKYGNHSVIRGSFLEKKDKE